MLTLFSCQNKIPITASLTTQEFSVVLTFLTDSSSKCMPVREFPFRPLIMTFNTSLWLVLCKKDGIYFT